VSINSYSYSAGAMENYDWNGIRWNIWW